VGAFEFEEHDAVPPVGDDVDLAAAVGRLIRAEVDQFAPDDDARRPRRRLDGDAEDVGDAPSEQR
jgi:hypothetical protein